MRGSVDAAVWCGPRPRQWSSHDGEVTGAQSKTWGRPGGRPAGHVARDDVPQHTYTPLYVVDGS